MGWTLCVPTAPSIGLSLYLDCTSTVKAVANAFASRGLRLIEIKKNQLHEIPHLVDQLSKNPLKFILFIVEMNFIRCSKIMSNIEVVVGGEGCQCMTRGDRHFLFTQWISGRLCYIFPHLRPWYRKLDDEMTGRNAIRGKTKRGEVEP